MFIEDSNIVKELIIVPQRNDANSRNTWTCFNSFDNNNDMQKTKYYSNYFLELCYKQYKNDLDFIRNNNNTINSYISTLKSFSKYTLKVSYFDNNNNYKCNSYSNLDSNTEIENYLKLCIAMSDPDHSPFLYYGMFVNENYNLDKDMSLVTISKNNFRYKILNNEYMTQTINSLKYIPYIDIQNNTMHINFTIPTYTTSILSEHIVFRKKDAIKINDILDVFNLWNMREIKHIPFIDDIKWEYYSKKYLIKKLYLENKGSKLINPISVPYLYDGINYTYYKNPYLSNIVRYPFSIEPKAYQPKGHLNLEKIDRLYINSTIKDIKKNDPDIIDEKIIMNIYLVTINKLVIIDNKIKLAL
jgi:hypothetical protein